VAATSAPAALVPVKLQVGWQLDAQNYGYSYALANGMYKKYGLDVTIQPYNQAVDIVQVTAAGQVDIGVSDPGPAMIAATKKIPIKSFAVTLQKAPRALTCRQDSGVTSLAGITDEKVLLGLKPAAKPLFQNLLAVNNIDESKVRTQPIEPSSVAEMIANRVQCEYTTFFFNEPEQIKAAGVPVNIMLDADNGSPSQAGALVTSADYYAKNKDILAKFYLATREAWENMAADPAAAGKWVVDSGKVPGLEVAQQQHVASGFAQLLYSDFSKKNGHGVLYPDADLWTAQAKLLLDGKQTDTFADVGSVLVTDIADMANKMSPAPPPPAGY
jgi:ABC-type nitrate/sulfonate/bicarbonate transport system substrate-binding protein